METKNKILVSMIAIVLMINFVSAFGISSPFWKGNPLRLYPGQTSDVNLNLQNMGTSDDINVKVELVEGNDVAMLGKNEFLVKAETKMPIPITIAVPANAEIGKTYSITLSTKTITPGGTGVVLGTGMDTSFDVEVIAKPVPKAETPAPAAPSEPKADLNTMNSGILWLIAVIIFAIIILVIYLKKKKGNTSKGSKTVAKKKAR